MTSKLTKKRSIIVSVLFFIFISGLFIFTESYGNKFKLSNPWFFSVDNGKTVLQLPRNRIINNEVNNEVKYFYTFDTYAKDQALWLQSRHQFIEVFVGNEKVFSNHDTNDNYGFTSYFIEVHDITPQSILTITMTSADPFYATLLQPVMIAPYEDLLNMTFIMSLPYMLLLYPSILIGIMYLICIIILPIKLKSLYASTSWGVFIILWSFLYLSIAPISHRIFSPQFCSFSNYGIGMILIIPIIFFISTLLKKYRKISFILAMIYSIITVVSFIFVAFDYTRIFYLYSPFSVLKYIFLVFQIIAIYLESRSNPELKSNLRILIFVISLVLFNNYLYYFGETTLINYLISIFLIAFVLRSFIRSVNDLLSYQVELNQEQNIMQLKSKIVNNTYLLLEKQIKTTSILRHEFRHNLLLLEHHLNHGDIEDYRRLLNAFNERHDFIQAASSSSFRKTLDYVIDEYRQCERIIYDLRITNSLYDDIQYIVIVAYLSQLIYLDTSVTGRIICHITDNYSDILCEIDHLKDDARKAIVSQITTISTSFQISFYQHNELSIIKITHLDQ